jgi:DNA-binding response OmpR family regulator
MSSSILIVDDKQSVLDFLELVFQRHGFQVMKASSGVEAVELAQASLPDIMLVDVMMPEVDGLEVCRRLRANPATAGLTILLYSSAMGGEIEAQVKQAGGDAFLGKTMNHSELVTQVRNWMLARAGPGGAGAPAIVKVAHDIISMLEVDLVWLLAVDDSALEHVAIACEQGEQQARRFLEVVGRGPFPIRADELFGFLLAHDHARLNVPIDRIRTTAGGKALGEAMTLIGPQQVSFAPLQIGDNGRGLLIFSGFSTLERSPRERSMVGAAMRYASAAMALWAA